MQKNWYFEKINKINKPMARLSKEKREKAQTKLEMKDGKLSQTSQKYKGVYKTKRLYATKFSNLEEMVKFLDV